MAADGSGNQQPFVVGSHVLSFAIFCGVNLPSIPAINPYVFDFYASQESSFSDRLQSCAQHNQRQAYEGTLQSLAQFGSAVTWDLHGRCYLKSGVTTFPAPWNGPGGAISAILQFPAITVPGVEINDLHGHFISQISGVNTASQNQYSWIYSQWAFCGGNFC